VRPVVFAALVALAGCGEIEPPPTARPTWVADVEPILRGNCFHCHGAGPQPDGAARWDFQNPDQARTTLDPEGKLVDLKTIGSAQANVALWAGSPAYSTPGMPTFMPPPPSPPLTPAQGTVLKNWLATMAPRGMRFNNRKPTVNWFSRPTVILVADADGEQVLGKVTCGAAEAAISHSGLTRLPEGWMPPCTITLFDGQDLVAFRLE
jgi:hypothetical protein